MKFVTTIFLLLNICFFLNLHGQEKQQKEIDSLIAVSKTMSDDSLKVAVFGTLYEKLMFKNPESSFYYAREELKLAKKILYKSGIASAQLHYADYYRNLGKLDSAHYYYQLSAENFRQIKNLKGELFVNHSRAALEKSLGNYPKALEYAYRNIQIYNQRDTLQQGLEKTFNLIGSEFEIIGSIHLEMGNYNLASKETFKAIRFFEDINDTLRTADALMQLGRIEYLQNAFETSFNHALKAYTIYNNLDDNEYKSYAAISIAQSLVSLNKIEEAEKYINEAIELGETLKNPVIQADALVQLGGANLELGELMAAKKNTEQGLSIHQKLNYKKNISYDLNQLARINLELGNINQAIVYLNQSIGLAKEIKAKNNQSEALNMRSEAFKRLGDYKGSLSDFEGHKALTDSIYTITKARQIEELKTIYETEKKEQQIALKEKEITVLEQKAEISNLQKFLLAGLLLLSLIGFYGLRQKMKRNKLEREKVDAELAFKKKELTTHALNLARKNEVLESLRQKAEELKNKEGIKNGYQQLIHTINFDLQNDNNWENFSRYFEEVHKDFNSNVKTKYPQVSSNELRLLALLKMNLSSKEIANILNISAEGIKKARYRLRKKLDIATEDSLQDLVLSL